MRPTILGFSIFLLVFVQIPKAYAEEDSKKQWIQGSWVNVRSTEVANSPVVDHLAANTAVILLTQKNSSCEISWGNGRKGFVACQFLGPKALDFVEMASFSLQGKDNPKYSPARAFWIAPSMAGLFNAGVYFQQKLLNPQQLQLEQGYGEGRENPQIAPRLVRYPVPEFDAMKAVLAQGVVAPVAADPPLLSCKQMQEAREKQLGKTTAETSSRYGDWQYPEANKFPYSYVRVHDCRAPELPGLSLPTVRPSFFKDKKMLLPGSAAIEQISAHFGIVEKGRASGTPKWTLDYDQWRYTGAWDIGRYDLSLEMPVYEHVIGRTGLVSAYRWTPSLQIVPNGASASCEEGLSNRRRGKELVADYPKVKDELMWFQSPVPLPIKTSKIVTRILQVPAPKDGNKSFDIKKIVSYEVDLNNDGVPDFIQWDIWAGPEINGPSSLLALRQVFVNINGEWYPFEQDSYGECT
ncbi:hypothetical protein ACO0K9_19775 [Undibacterium sp. Ji50W]|uniref:hypothetical protein n=1 Tax=Undibacterium sp. Ji50W TaxID=3413041 RepID=UPI003BF0B09E